MFINESRTWTLPITQEYSGALMSPYKHFLASLSIDDYGCKVLWVLKDPWHHNHECLLALMSAVGAMAPCSWVFMAAYEYSWGLMNAQGCPRALISAHDWSLHHTLGTHKHSWVFMSTHEHSYVAMSTQEHGTIAPTALMRSNEHLWAWCHGAIPTHSALAPYISVLKSAHDCSWVLLSAPEYSWVILSVQVLDSLMNNKCWFLKWLSFSILAISRSKFHQIIKNLIVLKSTRKGLLKNVQD